MLMKYTSYVILLILANCFKINIVYCGLVGPPFICYNFLHKIILIFVFPELVNKKKIFSGYKGCKYRGKGVNYRLFKNVTYYLLKSKVFV